MDDEYLSVEFTEQTALSSMKDVEISIRALEEIKNCAGAMGGEAVLETRDGLYSLSFNDTKGVCSFSVRFELPIIRLREFFAQEVP